MKKYLLFIVFILTLLNNNFAQSQTSRSFVKILQSGKQDPVLKKVLDDTATYKVQIIYTEITRNNKNLPSFKNHYFNYDPNLYFNPASIVKLPIALLALEKLQDLRQYGVDRNTTMLFDSAYERQVPFHFDSTSEDGNPSIGHFIKKIFLISDNDAYNRLYQFVGHEAIHNLLDKKGYGTVLIPRQFMGFTEEQNKRSNPVKFTNAKGEIIYQQPMLVSEKELNFPRNIKVGKGFMRSGQLVNEPFDFTRHNYMSLADMQIMLQSVIFPESVPAERRFNIDEDDRRFLLKFLSQYPSETDYPKYDTEKFFDSYAKFFFRPAPIPESIRVFNKTGWAYGYLTDISYVLDYKNNIEYMLSATVYTNSDGILNDGKYDYEDVGYPFLFALGQKILFHENSKKKKHKADFSDLIIQYDKRDPNDTRPSITEADN